MTCRKIMNPVAIPASGRRVGQGTTPRSRFVSVPTSMDGDNVVTVRFPSDGVEFAVGRRDERIQSIAVFQPLTKRVPAEKYRLEQDIFKQFKKFKY